MFHAQKYTSGVGRMQTIKVLRLRLVEGHRIDDDSCIV